MWPCSSPGTTALSSWCESLLEISLICFYNCFLGEVPAHGNPLAPKDGCPGSATLQQWGEEDLGLGVQSQQRGFCIPPSRGCCFSSAWHKMSVLSKERLLVLSHRMAWLAMVLHHLGVPSLGSCPAPPGSRLCPPHRDLFRLMEMHQDQQVSASATASGPSLQTPRGSQTPPVPWEPSAEKPGSQEGEGGGGSAPSPRPTTPPLLTLAVRSLSAVSVRVQGMESRSPRASSPWGEMSCSMLGKNRKGDTG